MGKRKYRPAIRHMNDSTSLERILEWFLQGEPNTIVLTDWEVKKKDRLKAAFHILTSDRDHLRGAPLMCRLFGITEPTAYQDFRDAKYIFGEMGKSEKDGERAVMISKIIRAQHRAERAGDEKTYSKYIDLEMKIRALDRDDPEMPDFESLQPSTIIIGYFPEKTGMPVIENPEEFAKKFLAKTKKVSADDAQIVEDDSRSDSTEADSL